MMSISTRIQRILGSGAGASGVSKPEQQSQFCALIDEVIASQSLPNLQTVLNTILSNATEMGTQVCVSRMGGWVCAEVYCMVVRVLAAEKCNAALCHIFKVGTDCNSRRSC
jgi:hypothetical protein